jgi:signal transduction histidine kinase
MSQRRPAAHVARALGAAAGEHCHLPWHHRARRAVGHSIKLRLVLLFLALAAAMTFVFVSGAQRAFSVGWRDAARPLLMDYVDHLAAEIAPAGNGPPSIARAQELAARLPITIDISGPTVTWRSHPEQALPAWQRVDVDAIGLQGGDAGSSAWRDEASWVRLVRRDTADGHRIAFGLNAAAFERRPRMVGYAVLSLLLLTLLAYLYVRRLLRPLDAITAGAQRFGAGQFDTPIPIRRPHKPDELGQLAATINTMGRDIHGMLEAKRALLLAISHELRSPLTRARLHTELLPEAQADIAPQREALQRDLQEMATLISDLLESERLASPHAALQREPLDLAALAAEVQQELAARHPESAPGIRLLPAADLPTLPLDASRMRMLLRNLLDNALRHGTPPGAPAPELRLSSTADSGITLAVRDFGPGVPEAQLPNLAEPFYRPDSARTRHAGGVGLGLNLCKLVAQAHGGTLQAHNANPGLTVTVTLPGDSTRAPLRS